MRNSRPALRRALRHDAAQRCGNFEAARFLFGSGTTGCNRSCGCRLHIRRENLAAGTRASHRREVDPQFLGEPPRFRRYLCICAGWRWRRWCRTLCRTRMRNGRRLSRLGFRVHSSSRSGRGRLALDGNSLTRRNDPRDRLSHGDVGALRGSDARQNAAGRSLDFDHGLVGFDVEQRFALGNAVALLPPPSDELAGFLRHLESGHHYAEGHSFLLGKAVIFRNDGL